MRINTAWHAKHKMPEHPTLDQKVIWHLEHARHCGCRSVSGEVLEEMKKRYRGTHQEFWIFFTRDDHKALARWAVACAQHVLPLFEDKYPNDSRPRKAIEVLEEWIQTGEFRMSVIRHASLSAHAAAREAGKDTAASFAARAVGQAVATAHVPTHALGPALYAIKAIDAANPDDHDAVMKEREWQREHLPERLRTWAISGLEQKQQLLPKHLRSLK